MLASFIRSVSRTCMYCTYHNHSHSFPSYEHMPITDPLRLTTSEHKMIRDLGLGASGSSKRGPIKSFGCEVGWIALKNVALRGGNCDVDLLKLKRPSLT